LLIFLKLRKVKKNIAQVADAVNIYAQIGVFMYWMMKKLKEKKLKHKKVN